MNQLMDKVKGYPLVNLLILLSKHVFSTHFPRITRYHVQSVIREKVSTVLYSIYFFHNYVAYTSSCITVQITDM